MKLFFRTFNKEIPFALNICFGLSVVLIVLMKFWWNNTPELFKGGFELGEIMDNIFMSIITGYIFYFIVDFIPKVEHSKKIIKLLSKNIGDTYLPYFILIHKLNDATGLDLYHNLNNPPILKKAFKLISTNSPVIKLEGFGKLNWFQLFVHSINTSKQRIENLYQNYNYLDIDLLHHIKTLDNSELIGLLKLMSESGEIEPDFSEYNEEFVEFIQNLKALQDYHSKHFEIL